MNRPTMPWPGRHARQDAHAHPDDQLVCQHAVDTKLSRGALLAGGGVSWALPSIRRHILGFSIGQYHEREEIPRHRRFISR